MTTITITLPRATVEQALEALEYFRDTAICSADTDTANEVIPALEDALAQQAEPTWVCPDSPEHRYAKPGHCEDCGKTQVRSQRRLVAQAKQKMGGCL